MREALKKVATALKAHHVPFALAGGYGSWARGGPTPSHDVDFVVPDDYVEQALDAVRARGDLRVEQPAEDWLVKAYDEDVLVDLIFNTTGRPVTKELVERADEMPVDSVLMPVLSATDLLVTKLWALTENYCDFASLLPDARALREQIDWEKVLAETAGSPYAESYLVLADRLEITRRRA